MQGRGVWRESRRISRQAARAQISPSRGSRLRAVVIRHPLLCVAALGEALDAATRYATLVLVREKLHCRRASLQRLRRAAQLDIKKVIPAGRLARGLAAV
ncbi:MAG: hypothetical protein LM577_07935 [Thermoproteaceae archaeon]|nr:hypothetical protein [Thermoproteaceae archaeon]